MGCHGAFTFPTRGLYHRDIHKSNFDVRIRTRIGGIEGAFADHSSGTPAQFYIISRVTRLGYFLLFSIGHIRYNSSPNICGFFDYLKNVTI